MARSSSTYSFTFIVRLATMDYNIPDPAHLASIVGHDVSLLVLQQLQMLLLPRTQLSKL